MDVYPTLIHPYCFYLHYLFIITPTGEQEVLAEAALRTHRNHRMINFIGFSFLIL